MVIFVALGTQIDFISPLAFATTLITLIVQASTTNFVAKKLKVIEENNDLSRD